MRTRAFTLIEVLLSIALSALVLTAMNTLIFSMGELWGKNSEARLFDQHVRAVTRYVQGEIRRACLPPAAAVNSTPIGVTPVTPSGGSRENLITFTELSAGRILRWPDNPLPEVTCSLQVRRGQGLYLLWHSDLENHFNDDPPRETLVSPLVTGLAYDYFDSDFNKWTTETVLRSDKGGNPVAPQRLRVTFTYDKMTRVTFVTVPAVTQGLPNPW